MKNLIKPLLALGVTMLFCFSFAEAQAPNNKPSQPINGGVVNGKASSLVKPDYPPEARKQRVSGTVNVQVVIDEEGNVISAKAVGGIDNAALRNASEAAAMKSKFSPTRLSGTPVKVTGVIVYNFVEAVVPGESAVVSKENAVVSNEAKVKAFAVSMFLFTLRATANDVDKFNKFSESNDMVQETIDEFSGDFPGLKALAGVAKLQPTERAAKIDEIIFAFKGTLNSPELWQFELGREFAVIMEQFLAIDFEESADLSKFDENKVKQSLAKIKDLCTSAPADFPRDVLGKLEELAKFDSTKQIMSAEHFRDFFSRIQALFETISPNSTK